MSKSKLAFYQGKVREAVGILVTNPSHLKDRLVKAGPLILLINVDELPNQELKDLVQSIKTRLAANFPDEGVSIGRKRFKTLVPMAEDIWSLYFMLETELRSGADGQS